MFVNMSRSSIALAAALALGLALSACAHNNGQPRRRLWRGQSGQRPGIQPDGRRPRLLRHRPDRSLLESPGDARQAGGVAQSVQQIQFHHRRARRRAGHARIQFRARLASRPGGSRLSRRQGRLRFAHEDDQLREGTAGRSVRRHFLLVAESPRGHGPQRRAGQQLSTRCERRARGQTRLEIDRCGAYAPAETNPIRTPPVTSSFRPSLLAAFVACFALAAPAQAQFNPFQRQPAPPADIPGGAANPNEAAELVVRVNQLEEALRQANGRIEELENAQHRLEAQLQKFRQDVEFRFGDRSAGAPQDSDVAEAPLAPDQPAAPPRPRRSDAFDPNADPNAPGAPRPLGTTPPSAPLVRETPLPRGTPAAGPPLELGRGPAPAPATGPTIVGSGVAMLDQPREQFNAALAGLSGRAISGGGGRFQVVSRRKSGASPDPGRDLLHRRDLSSALAPARGGRTISQGHDRLFQVVARAGEHGAARADPRRPRQSRAGLRDLDRIRQALPGRIGLGEEARRA